MLASGACRALVIALGYVYPAYKCFKALEKKRPEGIRAWCEYWLVLGIFTVLEQLGDQTIYWLPMYNESKVLCVLWLWHPRTQGAEYVYGTIISPLLQRHETEIDRCLDEGKARVGDAAYTAYQRTAAQIQNRFVSFVRNLPQPTEARGTPSAQPIGVANAIQAGACVFWPGPHARDMIRCLGSFSARRGRSRGKPPDLCRAMRTKLQRWRTRQGKRNRRRWPTTKTRRLCAHRSPRKAHLSVSHTTTTTTSSTRYHETRRSGTTPT